MESNSSHLAERIAERLRGVGGLVVPEPVTDRDTPRMRQSGLDRTPAARHPAGSEDAPAENSVGTGDHAAIHESEAEPAPPGMRVSRRSPGDAPRDDAKLSIIDATRRASPARHDATTATALAVSDPQRALPLDMAALEKAGLVVGHKVRTRISEEFRITVGHILRSMQTGYTPGRGVPNVIMVTSARPGEGKSFSCLNLAGSIAQHAQRDVLMVDVDAKQRSISAELGLADRPGLLDLSTNPALRVEDVIIRTAIPHLSVITIGSGHAVGTEMTPTRPVSAIIERIARRYPNAVVMLDAPPCLSTSDPSTLAPSVGQIVVIVEAERTQRNEVVAALDLIKACPSIMLMLNKIKLTTSYTFGAYHYFGTYS